MSVSINKKIITNNLVYSSDPANPTSFTTNLFPNSLDIFRFSQTGGTTNVTQSRDPDTEKSPAGGTPLRYVVTGGGTDPHVSHYNAAEFNIAPMLPNETITASVWTKASRDFPSLNGQLFIFGASSTGNAFVGPGQIAAGAIGFKTEWTRWSFTFTPTNSVVAFIQTRLDGPDSGCVAGDILWFDGLQIERGTSATTFKPMTQFTQDRINDQIIPNSQGTLRSFPNYPAVVSESLSFNGTNQGVVIPDTAELKPANALTVSTWAFRSDWLASSTTYRAIVSKTQAGSYQIGINDTGFGGAATLQFITYVTSAGGYRGATYPLSNLASGWHNIVGTFDGRFTRLYVDGALVSTNDNGSISGMTHSTSAVVLGGEAGAGNVPDTLGYFDGRVGQTLIYSTALTDRQILDNFNSTRGRYGV
jgi:hypothetical protein